VLLHRLERLVEKVLPDARTERTFVARLFHRPGVNHNNARGKAGKLDGNPNDSGVMLDPDGQGPLPRPIMTTFLVLSLLLGADGATLVHRQDAPRYAIADDKGEVSLLVQKDVAVSRLVLRAGAKVPEHSHEASETLVVLEGTCTVTVGGATLVLGAGDTLHLAAGEKHAAAVPADAKAAFVAVQIYSPAGPEQRFTKGKRL
jgi:quercetin dioxygenase-like cupin family protein